MKKGIYILMLVLGIFVVALTLSSCKSPEEKLEHYKEKLEDASSDKRVKIVNNILELDDELILDTLVYLMQDKQDNIRFLVVERMTSMDINSVVEYMIIAADDTNNEIQLIAMTKLGEYSSKKAMLKLMDIYMHAKSDLKQTAFDSLINFTSSDEGINEVYKIYSTKNIYYEICTQVITTHIENETINYELFIKRAFVHDPDYRPNLYKTGVLESSLYKYATDTLIDNEAYLEYAVKGLFTEDEELLYGAAYVLKAYLNKYKKLPDCFMNLYTSSEYEENPDYIVQVVNIITKLADSEGLRAIRWSLLDELENVDISLADKIYDTIIISFHNNRDATVSFFESILFTYDLDANSRIRDYIMATAYSNNVFDLQIDEYQNIIQMIDEGQKIWSTVKEDITIEECFIECSLYNFNAGLDFDGSNVHLFINAYRTYNEYGSKKMTAYIVGRYNELHAMQSTSADFCYSMYNRYANRTYAEYSYKDCIEELYLSNINPYLIDGIDNGIIIYSNEVQIDEYEYSLKWFNDMEKETIAYTPTHARYIVKVSTLDKFIGYYGGINTGMVGARRDVTVTVMDMKTGELLTSKKFIGGDPPEYSSAYYTVGTVDWNSINNYTFEQFLKYTSP